MIMFNSSSADNINAGWNFTDAQSKKIQTTYILERTANHTEISIMKTQWNNICKKIHAIKIKRFTFNFQEIIIGAVIPYAIDILSDYARGKTPNYFPVFICALLFFANSVVKKIIPIFNDYSTENQIHLEDLKEIIDEIDKIEDKK